MASLLVVGVIAEMLSKWSPTGALLFVTAVLIGYASTGGNLDRVTGFLNSVQQGGKR